MKRPKQEIRDVLEGVVRLLAHNDALWEGIRRTIGASDFKTRVQSFDSVSVGAGVHKTVS